MNNRNKEVKIAERGMSRRNLLKAGSIAALASAAPLANGLAFFSGSPQTTTAGERPDLFRVLTFWLALTNGNTNLTFPLSAATVEQVTGLKSIQKGDNVDNAIQYVNQNHKKYEGLKKEFEKFTTLFGYGPGQCPQSFTTLKKLADSDPNG